MAERSTASILYVYIIILNNIAFISYFTEINRILIVYIMVAVVMLVMSHDFMTKPLRVSPDLQAEAVSDVFNECDVNNDDNDASSKIKYEIELKSRYAKFIR